MTQIIHPAKHAGFILAVKSDSLINEIVANLYRTYDHVESYLWADGTSQQIVEINEEDKFWNFLQTNLYIAQRAQLEKNFEFRQLLPYCIVTRDSDVSPIGFEVLSYVRLKGGGESKLHDKSSIGFGGHVDISDFYYDEANVPNIFKTLAHGVYREVQKEELTITYSDDPVLEPDAVTDEDDIDPKKAPKFSKFLLLETNDITGRVHLGLVYRLHIPLDATVTTEETAQIELSAWDTFTNLQQSNRPWEGWTAALIEYYAKLELAKKTADIQQVELNVSNSGSIYGSGSGVGISE